MAANTQKFKVIKHCVDHNKLWEILKVMEILDLLTCLLKNLYARQEATPYVEQLTASVVGKEYVKVVYCHSVYLALCRVHHVKCRAG